jgi:hypothetical protein
MLTSWLNVWRAFHTCQITACAYTSEHALQKPDFKDVLLVNLNESEGINIESRFLVSCTWNFVEASQVMPTGSPCNAGLLAMCPYGA